MNFHDSERLAGLLQAAGYEATDEIHEADLVVVNTCSVRERAEEKLYARLAELPGQTGGHRPIVAVTGCVAQQEGARLIERAPNVDVVVGTQALGRLPALVDEGRTDTGHPCMGVAPGTPARHLAARVDINPYEDVSFPLGLAVRGDPVKAYVTIIEGCNDYCAFCVVPYTRGHERMRPALEILNEVAEAAGRGHREIHLLGQIVNHYQAPDVAGCDFAGLLERVHEIPGVERIRFASPHPRHVTPELIAALRDLPKVCKHLHLPAQSGSTRVLAAMRRRYTREGYLELVAEVREAVPDIALSTDMIVGFPGESTDEFDETLSLTAAVRYHSMFSFKYSERPNTLAARRMPDSVPEVEKTRRIVQLQALQKSIQTELHQHVVGRVVEVLVDARSRRHDHEFSGRTTGNTVVNFPGRADWIGKRVQIHIQRAGPNSLWGEVVRPPLD